jgi:hypothetical protein
MKRELKNPLAWRVQLGWHISPNMKTSLKLFALVLAAGYPVAAFAQFAGATLPAAINAQNVAGLFTAVFVGLMLLKDYSPRRLSLAISTAPVIVPPAHAFTGRADRLAA